MTSQLHIASLWCDANVGFKIFYAGYRVAYCTVHLLVIQTILKNCLFGCFPVLEYLLFLRSYFILLEDVVEA